MTDDVSTPAQIEKRPETRVGHTKRDSRDVYIGRGPGGRDMTQTEIGNRGWLGNPYALDDGYTREESIQQFREDFHSRLAEPEFRQAVNELEGKTLGCWCRSVDEDEPACHGDVIAAYLREAV